MEPISGPGGRYRARFELLLPSGTETPLRRPASDWRRQGASWVVNFGEQATARLTLGEGGITLHSLTLAKGGRAILQAVVEAGPGAPADLPESTTLRLFEGDSLGAAALRNRFFPLPRATGPTDQRARGEVPLEQLFVAVGRSIAQANRFLVEIESPGGTALVTTVTVTLSLDNLVVDDGQVLIRPAAGRAAAQGANAQAVLVRPLGAPATAQEAVEEPSRSIQFTLALAPGADPNRNCVPPSPSVSIGAPAASQSLVGLPLERK